MTKTRSNFHKTAIKTTAQKVRMPVQCLSATLLCSMTPSTSPLFLELPSPPTAQDGGQRSSHTPQTNDSGSPMAFTSQTQLWPTPHHCKYPPQVYHGQCIEAYEDVATANPVMGRRKKNSSQPLAVAVALAGSAAAWLTGSIHLCLSHPSLPGNPRSTTTTT
jgi:hypothetical protein